jgi:hypothetical protein
MKDRRVKWVFSGEGYRCGGGGHKERKNKGTHGHCILYTYMKIEE